MKTRIKIIELRNGTKYYVPQVRRNWLFTIILLNVILIFFGVAISLWDNIDRIGNISFLYENKLTSEEEARIAIDLYLKNQEVITGKNLKKNTYKKYP